MTVIKQHYKLLLVLMLSLGLAVIGAGKAGSTMALPFILT